jgi:hypothetical protein
MHPLHDYIAGQIADRLKDRRVVVMYDKREELRPFFEELAGKDASDGALVPVAVGPRQASLYVFDGSFLKVRAAVEKITGSDQSEEALIYVPALERDAKGSLLMELEKAGIYYLQPALKQLARLVLRKRFTDVAIDEMLTSDNLTYADLARMAGDEAASDGASLLKSVFGNSDTTAILTTWIAEAERDGDLETKGALGELRAVVLARLGLSLQSDATTTRLRAITARYVLANELRSDLGAHGQLSGAAASALKAIPTPATGDQHKAVREVAKRLRERYAAAYAALADGVESELGLTSESVRGVDLVAIDTFRFEEKAVVAACFDLISADKIPDAAALLGARSDGFWVNLDLGRKTVWAVARQMVDLGTVAARVCSTIAKANGNAAVWVERYVKEDDGWFKLDHAQRKLEVFLASVDEPVDERATAKIRLVYEEAVRRMTEGFVKALQKVDWAVPGVLQQARIWSDIVATRPVPVAFIMVDAMRFEMGHELISGIARASEIRIMPALCVLPSITPIGMAALLPGAAATFSAVVQKGRFGASVDGSFLPDLGARQKYLKSRLAAAVDLTLEDVIDSNAATLKRKIGAASVIMIRSTEIDGAGENITTSHARRIMDNVVGDIGRCLQRLAAAGIGEAVVTADHGHLFFATDRDPSMRLEAPGGETVDLHRRCWIGRGGTTPPGSVRVAGSKLGYAGTDLDFVFPASTSVFKSGGGLAYHHGGPSLQELVIPVITIKLKAEGSAKAEKNAIAVTHEFDAVTNRIFTVQIELGSAAKGLFDGPRKVRPLVLSDDRTVASAAIATDAVLEEGRLTLTPGGRATVAFMLTDDTVKHIRLQVLDADTDAVLYLSPRDIPVRLGV